MNFGECAQRVREMVNLRGTPTPKRGIWAALIRQRCPRCREGKIFRGLVTMNDPCPVCGLLFQREEGYFLGAMYVSYFFSSGIYLVLHALWSILRDDWFSYATMFRAMATFLPLVPLIFRYSRVVWIYLDRDACPTDFSAGPYEKMRLRQLQQNTEGPN
jgi:uncharacterized protein (DUF983 family)